MIDGRERANICNDATFSQKESTNSVISRVLSTILLFVPRL